MENRMQGLSLVEDEEEGLSFDVANEAQKEVDPSLCLLGRFFTDRQIRPHVMKDRMAGAWQPVKGVTIKEVSSGILLCQFYHRKDVEEVLKGSPWIFDNYLLILARVRIGIPLHSIPLHYAEFRVQAHNLPMGFMSEMVGKHLANYIGEFVEYDQSNNGSFWRTYMRIRVRLDVRQPLKIERKVRKTGEEWCIVKFKYEKLPCFCFMCGCIGHTDQKCQLLFDQAEDDGIRKWSIDIRVEPRRQRAAAANRWLKDDKHSRGNPRMEEEGDDGSKSKFNDPIISSAKCATATRNKGKAIAIHNDVIMNRYRAGGNGKNLCIDENNDGALLTTQQQNCWQDDSAHASYHLCGSG